VVDQRAIVNKILVFVLGFLVGLAVMDWHYDRDAAVKAERRYCEERLDNQAKNFVYWNRKLNQHNRELINQLNSPGDR
jgi:hypothetical protein